MASKGKKIISGIQEVLRITPKEFMRRVWHDSNGMLRPNERRLNLATSRPMNAIRGARGKLAQVQRETEEKVAQKAITLLERTKVITPKQAKRARIGLEVTRQNVIGDDLRNAGSVHHEWVAPYRQGYPLFDPYYGDSRKAYASVTGIDFRNRKNRMRDNAEQRLRINSKRDMHPMEYRHYKLTGEAPPRIKEKYLSATHSRNEHPNSVENRALKAVYELGQNAQDVRYALRRGGLIGSAIGAKLLYDRMNEKPKSSGGTNTKKRMSSKYY